MRKIGTYRVMWKGKKIAVEARVQGDRVEVYSYHEVRPEGYQTTDREDKAGARGGRTDHDDPDEQLAEGQHATALSTWPECERVALCRLVRKRARERD